MINRIHIIFCLALITLSCNKGTDMVNENVGWLNVALQTDQTVQSRDVDLPYALTIVNSKNDTVQKMVVETSLAERILLPVGQYTIIAQQGDYVDAGFNTPFYRGVSKVDIQSAKTKELEIKCTLASVMVSAEYSQKIQDSFKDYTLTVKIGKDSLVFPKGENRVGYIVPDGTSLKWYLKLNNGQEIHELTKTIPDVKVAQYYKLKFDIQESADENNGAFLPSISVDPNITEIKEYLFLIPLKDNLAKPTIEMLDGTNVPDKYLILNEKRGAEYVVQLRVPSNIQEMRISHTSSELEKRGIPRSCSLVDGDGSLLSSLTNAGIDVSPNEVLDKQNVQVTFNRLMNMLPLGDYAIRLLVYDAKQNVKIQNIQFAVIPDIEHIALAVSTPEVWAKQATIRGRWYTIERPEGLTIEYREENGDWIAASCEYDSENKTIKAVLSHLKPATKYYYRTKSNTLTSITEFSFTTENALQIPYMNFDSWYKDGKSPVVGVNNSNIVWDSGNKGGASFGYTPTTQETSVVINGSAVKMESQYAVVKFAAGNIYTGSFGGLTGTNAKLNFGYPYTSRPKTLSGYYKYLPKAIDKADSRFSYLKGKLDSCHIYIGLFDWNEPYLVDSSKENFVDLSRNNKSLIAFGELKESKTMSDYEKFIITLDYYNSTKTPKYILIVASASKYGDYFTGGVGSTLYIDEFELGFD